MLKNMNNPPARMPQRFETTLRQRNRNQSCEILWRENKFKRLKSHDPKRVEFLGHFHSPNLCREGGAGSSTYRNRRHQRSELAGEANCDQVNDVAKRAKTAQFRRALHGKDESSAN